MRCLGVLMILAMCLVGCAVQSFAQGPMDEQAREA